MFKVTSIEFVNHHHLGNLLVDLVNAGEEYPLKEHEQDNKSLGPYNTLIIGPNGTGKSQILSSLTEIFNFLSNPLKTLPKNSKAKSKIKTFHFEFILNYFLDDKKVIAKYLDSKLDVTVNGESIAIPEIPFPAKLIAASISLTDRFPLLNKSSKEKVSFYEYQGIRSTTNAAYINKHTISMIESLRSSLEKFDNMPNIVKLFETLDLEPSITISFKAGARLLVNKSSENYFFSIINSQKDFTGYYSSIVIESEKKGRKDARIDKFKKILKDDFLIETALEYIKSQKETFNPDHRKGEIRKDLQLVFNNEESKNAFSIEIEALRILRDLEILKIDKVILRKRKAKFKLEHASSGEYHLISSLIGIAAKIEKNSLVIIDEPEISLHPNWQMDYVKLLTSIFEKYEDSHFIIATHSHFMISDVEKPISNVVQLSFTKPEDYTYNKKNLIENPITSTVHEESTFGWSAEEVLYYIFQTRTTRNQYFQFEIQKLLELISTGSKDFTQIEESIIALRKYSFKEADPLNEILNTAVDYLRKKGYASSKIKG